MRIDIIDGRSGAIVRTRDVSPTLRFIDFPTLDGGRMQYEIARRADGSAFIVLEDDHAEAVTGVQLSKPLTKQ